MSYSLFKKLAAVTAGTALMFAVGENIPAQAATITYSFSNTSNSLTGILAFDSADIVDQQVTVPEGLTISANFDGQVYTQADDSGATFFTSDSSGGFVPGQGLGLSFIVPNVFTVNSETFIDPNDPSANGVQTVTYNSVPEPEFILAPPLFGLFLLLYKKQGFSRPSRTKV